MRAFPPLLFSGLLLLGSLAEAADPAPPDFKKDVLPVFEEKCIRCHGAKRKGGKLDMRTLEAMLEGGDTGPALKPGNAKKSLLIELIHYKEMPPKKDASYVTPAELEMLRLWINSMPGKA
ncbi:c-type cytochrome domain-containing protein [Prosthecobacter sp.]|uniref:c-type cytochrome domain-containing protein n=1 Tax=Prosthecobacter sp. TaxID=1965333 RepID=UPI003785029F